MTIRLIHDELICLFPLYYRRYRGLKLIFSPPPQTMVPCLGFVMGPVYARHEGNKGLRGMNGRPFSGNA